MKEIKMLSYRKKIIAVIGWALVSGLLSGCTTSEPTFGDQIAQQGNSTAALGESWNCGEALIKEGQELINDGQSDVSKGESRISEGRSKIAKGEQMRRNAEETYRQLYPATQVPTTY